MGQGRHTLKSISDPVYSNNELRLTAYMLSRKKKTNYLFCLNYSTRAQLFISR